MLCRSCQRVRANRPRGLCYSCYYNPEVRARFPSTSKFARKGNGIGIIDVKLSIDPTYALPGTEEKIRVLMDRVLRQEELFHPHDAPIPYPGFTPREQLVVA